MRSIRRTLELLLCCHLSLGSALAAAAAPSASQPLQERESSAQGNDTLPPWNLVHSHETLRVWARQRVQSPVHELRAQRVIDAPPERVWEVLGDVDRYKEFMPYVAESRVVAATANRIIEYFRIDPPLVSQRDYTVQTTVEEDLPQRRFVRRWHAANHQGPPPRKDSVRLQLCDGSWTVESHAHNQTKLTYWLYTDPAGSLPSWVTNRASRRSIPEMLQAVASRAQDPSFHR
jgi:ribosome-associated toxin RatA of RatAB toxin-antitoxin module